MEQTDLSEAVRMMDRLEALREQAAREKDPDKAAELRLQEWELSLQLRYLMKH